MEWIVLWRASQTTGGSWAPAHHWKNVRRGSAKKNTLIIALAHSRSGVFYHNHFTSHTPPLIHFRGKMNYLPPTVNTGIMENYKQSLKESAGFSLRAARVIVTPACFQTEISLRGRWEWHCAVLTDARWCFTAKVRGIHVVQQRAVAKFFRPLSKCCRLSAIPESKQTWRKSSVHVVVEKFPVLSNDNVSCDSAELTY